ncbi:MAG: hypothetical protein IJP64_04670 [Oscillospiraceae bacterium]|nr:hypothetical protein [Oscillospiraceae bacterium]
MYSDKTSQWRVRILAALALILVLAIVFTVITAAKSDSNRENAAAAIRRTVENSARQCYVIEGVYPPDLKYLEENYGLQINTDDFYVQYEIYASNQPPTVKVVGK